MNRLLLLWLLLALPSLGQPVWPPRTFSAYYGKIEADTPAQLGEFDLVIVHPGDDQANLDTAKVRLLRQTGRPKTLVGYISIGEDGLSPGGPPLLGQDTSGPSFVGKDLKEGRAAADYPAYFMDQRRLILDASGFPTFGPNGKPLVERGQDGQPDENGVWGSYYAKADDPVWRAKLFARLDHLDKLGLDGFFLDTVDTASPWGDYGWTSVGMLDLVEKIRARYPDKKIVANRGLFYLSQNDRFAKAVDAVLFESLLTAYREETRSAGVNQWARWHVEALEKDVIPSVRRNGLTLLVLDYLEPDHRDAPILIQSLRTLLGDAPHSLSFSRPSLRIPGWPAESLLPEPVPDQWPSVTGMTFQEKERGAFTVEVDFDGPVPAQAIPDLRLTTRTDLAPRLAAELPLTRVEGYERLGSKVRLSGSGLDRGTTYSLFFRLISRSPAPQSAFGWTTITTAPGEGPAQVSELSSDSNRDGVVLSFASQAPVSAYRVYRVGAAGLTLLKESPTSPVTLPEPAVGEAVEVVVTALDEQGRESYPSLPYVAVRRDVVPPAAPGPVTILSTAEGAAFRWAEVSDVRSYRLYTIPEGQRYRLPLVCKQPEALVSGARPGTYRVFATSVDKDGNQSGPGPSVSWKVK